MTKRYLKNKTQEESMSRILHQAELHTNLLRIFGGVYRPVFIEANKETRVSVIELDINEKYVVNDTAGKLNYDIERAKKILIAY